MQRTGPVRAVLGTAIILSLLVVGIGELRAQGSMQMPPNPANVLIIVLDDIGVDQIGCYWENYPGPEMIPIGWEVVAPITPNIDALAAAGTRFTNAWSSPVCSPTRAQIMTGMHPSQTGIGTAFNRTHDWPGLPGGPGTRLGSLALNRSAAVGKWHLAGLGPNQNSHPCEIGGFSSFLGTLYNLNLHGDAVSPCSLWNHFMCWNQFTCDSGPAQVNAYATARTTDDAITKMADLEAAGGPWLLYVAYHASHAPYHCPPGYDNETGWLASCVDVGNGYHDDRVYKTRAMTQALDIEIGRLLDYLDRLANPDPDNDYDNTAVILICDNGTEDEVTIAPFPANHAKNTVYQGGINVPLIIRAPGTPMPNVSNELVSATDVYATTQHFLTGKAASVPLDANSVAALVDGDYGTFEPRTYVYSESFTPNFNRVGEDLPASYHAGYHMRAVRDDKYKLIDLPNGGREFYCLWDATLEPQHPAPQDPAILDPFGHGYGSVHSPFEDIDLLGMDPESWPEGAATSYSNLSEQLDTAYPPLPWGQHTALMARSTDGTGCDDTHIDVGFDGFEDVSRAFLEFEIPSNVAEVYSAHLSVVVMEGGNDASRTLKVWPVMGTVSQIPCSILHGALDVAPYGEVDGWTGEEFAKVIHLGGSAKDYILAAAGGPFSVGITLGDETQAYNVRLHPINEISIDDPDPPFHRLILRYRTSAGQQMMAEVPATPVRENRLAQSYPNPFNPTATIAYAVKEPSHVSLHVYDVSGALVRTLVDRAQPAGDGYKVVWDGRNDAGQPVSSGVYFYRLTVGDFVDSKKMVMLK